MFVGLRDVLPDDFPGRIVDGVQPFFRLRASRIGRDARRRRVDDSVGDDRVGRPLRAVHGAAVHGNVPAFFAIGRETVETVERLQIEVPVVVDDGITVERVTVVRRIGNGRNRKIVRPFAGFEVEDTDSNRSGAVGGPFVSIADIHRIVHENGGRRVVRPRNIGRPLHRRDSISDRDDSGRSRCFGRRTRCGASPRGSNRHRRDNRRGGRTNRHRQWRARRVWRAFSETVVTPSISFLVSYSRFVIRWRFVT